MSNDANRKIEPINLTARLRYPVPGNPSVTRPEDIVANCYPGLEVDVRNLERRFFPGLVFEFIARNDVGSDYSEPHRYGARVCLVDLDQDPDLQVENTAERAAYYKACETNLKAAEKLRRDLTAAADLLTDGYWYLDWVEQGGKRLSMDRVTSEPPSTAEAPYLDGLFVWRLVRSLELGAVKIGLKWRDLPDESEKQEDRKPPEKTEIELAGWRRRFLDPETGVINAAYQPGEMLQSLCSPWQHDFRDCYCHYWAVNHPDLVFAAPPSTEEEMAGQTRDLPPRVPLDWLRADRSGAMAAAAFGTHEKNRPHQFDHYQMNSEWENLSIVVNNTELAGPFIPHETIYNNPLKDPEELAEKLRTELAPLELTLALEYLYARFSLKSETDDDVTPNPMLSDDLLVARHHLLLVATSEMQHLRWVNELLWRLHDEGLVRGDYVPVFELAAELPAAEKTRKPQLRRLEPDVLDGYIFIEHPSTLMTGKYAQVIATLQNDPYRPEMLDVALRIAQEGADHERTFIDMKRVLSDYEEKEYLRDVEPGSLADQRVVDVGVILGDIVGHLTTAYQHHGDFATLGPEIAKARMKMDELLTTGNKLASAGVGIPFFDIWPTRHGRAAQVRV